MKKEIFLMFFIILLATSVFALTKPNIKLIIPQEIYNPSSIIGDSCTNEWSTTGDYCSGLIRIYYQCVPSLNGLIWEQRSENCGSYGGRCMIKDGVAQCVDLPGETPYSHKVMLIGFGLAGVFLIFGIFSLVLIKKKKVTRFLLSALFFIIMALIIAMTLMNVWGL